MRGEQATFCLDPQKGALRPQGGSRSTSVHGSSLGMAVPNPSPQQPGLSHRKGSSATGIPAQRQVGVGRGDVSVEARPGKDVRALPMGHTGAS